MTASDKLAAMRIFSILTTAFYYHTPELLPLIIVKQINLSIQYGNTAESTIAYTNYGLILCGIMEDIDSGYQFGQLALSLLERFTTKKLKAKTIFYASAWIKHWKEHARETLQNFLDAYSTGLETGDLEFAALSALLHSYTSYFIGKELTVLEQDVALYSDFIAQLKQEAVLSMHKIYHQTIMNLRNTAKKSTLLLGEAYNEKIMLPVHEQANNRTTLCHLFLNKFILCYLFNNYFEAVENAENTKKYLDSLTGTFTVPTFYFYASLVQLSVYAEASNDAQEHMMDKVIANQKKMQKWAHHAPMNHLHKFYLVEAERYRVLGQYMEAMDYYDKAIAGAKENEYLNEEALAYELAAKFYLALGKEIIARTYMSEALYAYTRWGALAKVKDLEANYPQLLPSSSSRPNITSTSTTNNSTPTGSQSASALDLATVMKASLAISGEIVLDKLLASLMKILIQNAGAQTGFLILDKAGEWVIEASGEVDIDNVTVLQSIPIERRLPASIINYVTRTRETVVENDAAQQGKFTLDPYIKANKTKSILCAPLINQGQLSGIVYLENNLIGGAFTPDRLEVIQLLSGQAAIAITNATLYAEVTASERRLTQFFEAMPLGVSVHDATGQLYYANQSSQELLGINALPEAKAAQLSVAYHVYRAGTQQLYPNAQLPIARSLCGEQVKVDDLEIHQPDKIVPLEVSSTPILDETGKIVYAIAAFQDITQRKQAEKLIAEYNRTLEEQVKERTAQLAEANQEIIALNEKLKAENLRMSAELEVTKQLQQMVLPKREELDSIEGLEIAGYMEPADEVGGDYYDVLQQDGKVKIGIGDVTGHGLESGVLMLMTQTAVRTLQQSNQTDPVQFLDILNRTVYRNAQRINPYKNLTLALLDYSDGTLSISGQHEEIIVVRTSGEVERIDTTNLGFPLGLEEEIADFIASEQVQLNPGDVVVLYTDGITEAFDIDYKQYGLDRLCEVLSQNCDRSAQDIRQAVIEDVRQHIGEQKVFDDITLVVLKQK
ncbi:MAG: SpoIIE family protein phosphatase [Cyanobacteriota bacterium]